MHEGLIAAPGCRLIPAAVQAKEVREPGELLEELVRMPGKVGGRVVES